MTAIDDAPCLELAAAPQERGRVIDRDTGLVRDDPRTRQKFLALT